MAILILLLLVLLNGVFAMSEMAVVSSRKVRLKQAADKGDRRAAAALALVENPTRFLSTVQIGITLVGIIAGAYGGAALKDDLAATLEGAPGVGVYAEEIAFTLIVLAITYLNLIVGELVPKRLALASPEKIASFVAGPMRWLSWVAAPAVHFLSFSTELVLKILPGAAEQHAVTQEEVSGMIEQGMETGVFHEAEQVLVERVFRLGDQRVKALMVPRGEIDWIEADASVERIRVAVATSPHSHFPVCRGGLDHIVGVVHVKDLVKAGLIADDVDVVALAQPPLYVPETMPALEMLERFREGRTHIAFVLDEYGAVEGLVTLNDVVERIVGEVTRQGEETEPLAVQRADGSWLLDGMVGVDQLKQLMNADELPKQDEAGYQTLSGLVMSYLGRIPHAGDAFGWGRYRFEVVDMDRQRVDKVLLTIQDPGLLVEAPE